MNKQDFLKSVKDIKYARFIFEFKGNSNVIGNFISIKDDSLILFNCCVADEEGKAKWYFKSRSYDINDLQNCIQVV